MATGGPSREERRRNADIAQRLEVDETPVRLIRETMLVTLISGMVWALCSALRWAVHTTSDGLFHWVEQNDSGWHLLALPAALCAGGLATGLLLLRKDWKAASGDGVDVALDNYHCTYDHLANDPQPRYSRPSFGLTLRKLVMSLFTLGSGASGGLEGPVVLMGETLGAAWSKVFKVRDEFELRTYQMAGIAAAVGTLLGAPFTAALFATELVYTDRIVYRKFSFSLLAGMVVYVLNQQMLDFKPLFVAPEHGATFTFAEYGTVAAVALAVSLPLALGLGLGYRQVMQLTHRFPAWVRGAAAATLSGILVLALWQWLGLRPVHLLGMGEHTLQMLLDENNHDPALQDGWILCVAVLARILTTGLTIQSGGSAGMLVPGMFLGGVSGAATFHGLVAIGLTPGPGPAIFVVAGIATSLVALAGVPLAAIALVLEVFGPAYGPPAILSCGLCYVLTRNVNYYAGQRKSPDPGADEAGRQLTIPPPSDGQSTLQLPREDEETSRD